MGRWDRVSASRPTTLARVHGVDGPRVEPHGCPERTWSLCAPGRGDMSFFTWKRLGNVCRDVCRGDKSFLNEEKELCQHASSCLLLGTLPNTASNSPDTAKGLPRLSGDLTVVKGQDHHLQQQEGNRQQALAPRPSNCLWKEALPGPGGPPVVAHHFWKSPPTFLLSEVAGVKSAPKNSNGMGFFEHEGQRKKREAEHMFLASEAKG